MNKVNAVMVGGLFDENGISAFARPVLFGTAGDAMRDELPDAVEACFFVHDDRESAVAGAQDIALDAANRFASLAALPESEHVLVLAAPFALAEEDALFHLAETHLNTGYGVSVLSAEQQGFDAEGQPLPRDSRCYAAMFTWDMLKRHSRAALIRSTAWLRRLLQPVHRRALLSPIRFTSSATALPPLWHRSR